MTLPIPIRPCRMGGHGGLPLVGRERRSHTMASLGAAGQGQSKVGPQMGVQQLPPAAVPAARGQHYGDVVLG
jgi:hypothetical protein